MRRLRRRMGLRRLAFSALTACFLSAASFLTPSLSWAADTRPAATQQRRAAPAPVRASTPAQPRRATASARTSRSGNGRQHVAHRSSAGREPRLRDSSQDLIPVLSQDMRASLPSDPRAACLAATRRAEEIHGLPRGLLTAIALAESGLHAYALSIGGRAHFPQTEEAARALYTSAPSGRSIMAGCVQVNARVHARNSTWPLDPMASADWAGGMMARWAAETGSWPEALRRWHGGSPASTQRLVCRVRAKMEVTNPDSTLFDSYSCNDNLAERTRRNGAAHLATAQRQTY
ncbi:hypothetical protein [Roseococcus sp. YIM B11640]|uniref:hypothetical protein n=1 Tax=Roseococcus sp. YIM B11640 TaxID=3133973 RepID=UPI003C7AB43E